MYRTPLLFDMKAGHWDSKKYISNLLRWNDRKLPYFEVFGCTRSSCFRCIGRLTLLRNQTLSQKLQAHQKLKSSVPPRPVMRRGLQRKYVWFVTVLFVVPGGGESLSRDAWGMRQSINATSRASVSQTPPVEVRYPFGVQNDLGQVYLNSIAKVCKFCIVFLKYFSIKFV